MHHVQSHPASVDAYIRHGWSLVPIPDGTKGPRNINWNKREFALRSQSDLPAGYGIGLAHAYSGTMAFDIDNWDMAAFELGLQGININELYNAPDSVIIDSGRPGRGKLLYKMPHGITLPTKKIIQGKSTLYELRCATANGLTVQDVLPPTIHPLIKKSYRWAGNGNWERLPIIPPSLLKLWENLIAKENERVLNTGDGTVNASWSEIKAAVESIDPGTVREEWVTVGMALHWAGVKTGKEHEAFTIWNEWSRESDEKYPGERGIQTQWASFKADKQTTVTLGTLFHIAKHHGWQRPLPDASDLFASVDGPDAHSQIIENMRPSPPDINLDLFPSILSQRAREISEHVGCDPLVPLFAGLSVVCGAINAESRLELMQGFKVPPVLWLMTIGSPADKKSPGSLPMFDILNQIEHEDRPRFKKALLDWEGIEAAFSSAKKSFLEWSASPDALLGGEPPPVGELPPRPVPLRISVSDITSQKLVRHAADHPRGLLCHLDEMSTWMKKLVDRNSGEDRAAWVVCYESKPYTMDRVGSGSILCDNLAVSIYGNVQPKVFKRSLKALAEDGLLQRFIPAVLRGGQTRMGHPVPEYMTNKFQWDQAIRLIFALPEQQYRLSNEAYTAFRDFQVWYEARKQDERLLSSSDAYMTAFGKLEGTVGRLALVFHVLEQPFSPVVSRDTVERVIEFTKSYIIQSFRYTFGEVGGTQSFDVWTTDHIINICGDKDTVSLSELKRSARRHIEDMTTWQSNQLIIDSMLMLEQAKWVVVIEDQISRNHMVWAINPALKDMFKDYRNKVDKAKRNIKM